MASRDFMSRSIHSGCALMGRNGRCRHQAGTGEAPKRRSRTCWIARPAGCLSMYPDHRRAHDLPQAVLPRCGVAAGLRSRVGSRPELCAFLRSTGSAPFARADRSATQLHPPTKCTGVALTENTTAHRCGRKLRNAGQGEGSMGSQHKTCRFSRRNLAFA